jgi:O-succinylbenzoate synthase
VLVSVKISDKNSIGLGSGICYCSPPVSAYKQFEKYIKPVLSQTNSSNLDEIRLIISKLFGKVDGGILYAADLALWDYEARLKSVPVARLWGKIRRSSIPITEQTWAFNFEELEPALQQIKTHGTKYIKIKLNMGTDYGENELQKFRRYFDNQAILKIDLNGYFTDLDTATNTLNRWENLDVDLVEDPLKELDFTKYRKLKKSLNNIKIMLDVNLSSVEQIKKALSYDAFDLINIKLSRVGGITRALPLIKECEKYGKKVSIGCCEDIGPSMYGILHLSSIVENYYGTEGVGCTRMYAKALPEEPFIQNGVIELSDYIGLIPFDDFLFEGQIFMERIKRNPSLKFRIRSLIRQIDNRIH